MTGKTPGQVLLEGAYSLETPADSVRFYRSFAPHYDADFAEGLGYQMPALVAARYRELAKVDDAPVADIGCGTGLVASHLSAGGMVIDGFDISPEMLARARAKNLYRNLYQIDLTASLEAIPGGYGAVVSSGTFTHGHLGPEPLAALLGIARAGALFVIAINRAHFEARGFAAVLDELHAQQRITTPAALGVRIYARDDHLHAGDEGLIVTWRRQ